MPDKDPDWVFGPEQDLSCPVCKGLLSGLDWIISEPVAEEIEPGVTQVYGPVVTGMDLVPCGHRLDADVWELKFHGRNRVIGTVTKNPIFVKKKGY